VKKGTRAGESKPKAKALFSSFYSGALKASNNMEMGVLSSTPSNFSNNIEFNSFSASKISKRELGHFIVFILISLIGALINARVFCVVMGCCRKFQK